MVCDRGLDEASVYQSDLTLGFPRKHEVEATFGFAWDPAISNPILVFSPVPGGTESRAARLNIEGAKLASVEYGETEALCAKYWPEGLRPTDGLPYRQTTITETED
jgi:hypothetical protein